MHSRRFGPFSRVRKVALKILLALPFLANPAPDPSAPSVKPLRFAPMNAEKAGRPQLFRFNTEMEKRSELPPVFAALVERTATKREKPSKPPRGEPYG